MYPKLLHIGSFTLYSYAFFVVIGLLAAAFMFRFLADKLHVGDKIYNFYLLTGVGSIAVGFMSAMLFQSVYYLIETGKWTFGAMTFMGGLIGGVVCFLAVTAIAAKKEYKTGFWRIANIITPSIPVAHAFGRIGCFMNGCCYGVETDGPLGVLFPGHTHKVFPTQLFEAAFLFLLCAALVVLILKYRRLNIILIVYLFAYSVFRFVLEFWRGDDRGEFIGGLSPSQWQSVFMFVIAVALTVCIFRFRLVPFAGKCSVNSESYRPVSTAAAQPTDNTGSQNAETAAQPTDNTGSVSAHDNPSDSGNS